MFFKPIKYLGILLLKGCFFSFLEVCVFNLYFSKNCGNTLLDTPAKVNINTSKVWYFDYKLSVITISSQEACPEAVWSIGGFYELEYRFNLHSKYELAETFATDIRRRHNSILHTKWKPKRNPIAPYTLTRLNVHSRHSTDIRQTFK